MKNRLLLVLLLAGLWMAGLAVRLVYLQGLRHEHYVDLAARQQQQVVDLTSPRGTIYDARGRVLAVSVPVDSAWTDPQEVTDPEALAREVARVLPGRVRPEELTSRLVAARQAGKRFLWLERKLDAPQAAALRTLGLDAVEFVEETKRYYPMRSLAGAVLGFVGTDDHGLAGLEQVYDEQIAGRPVERIVLRDARRGTAVTPDLPFREAQPGRDLRLSLDAAIQHVVEGELAQAVERHEARGGSIVVLDPRTGRVLAMASQPGFDPNHFGRYAREVRRNRVVQDAYEPGSTFKMVTAAAALAENVLDPSDTLDCLGGSIVVSRTRIHDHKPFGLLTFREVIAKSSNVGAILAGLKVGPRALHDQTRAFGFGGATGIDLPGEHDGLLHPVERWHPVHTANVAFGQGVSVTPIQLATAFAAVADEGVLRRPRLAWETPGETRGRPLTPAVARELERMLETVVEDGTAKAAAVPGYTVAGKTGTAQKADPRGGGYLRGRYVATFTGFVPARDPVLVASVMIDEPRPPFYHGGQAAAPVFGELARRILLYLGTPRERPPVEHQWAVRSVDDPVEPSAPGGLG